MRLPLLMVLFSLPGSWVLADGYEYNSRCTTALENVLALRLDDARKLIEQERKENKSNLLPYYIENTIDFITIYIHEEEDEFELLEKKERGTVSCHTPW